MRANESSQADAFATAALHIKLRRFSIKLGSEAVRVGQALGYQLVNIGKLDPERLALAGEGHADAFAEV